MFLNGINLCSGDLSSVCLSIQSIHSSVVGSVHCHSKVAVDSQYAHPTDEEGIGIVGLVYAGGYGGGGGG